MRPYATAASVVPATAIRNDPAVLLTTLGRYAGDLVASGGKSAALVQPFSKLVAGVVHDPFIKNWLDLLCFLLSGLPADGTIAAEVRDVAMLADRVCVRVDGGVRGGAPASAQVGLMGSRGVCSGADSSVMRTCRL